MYTSHASLRANRMNGSICLQLDNREDGDEIQQVMGELTGATSVPRVFIGGNFIGANIAHLKVEWWE